MSDNVPDNLPSSLPPRDFSNFFSRWIYYISTPQMLTVVFIYFWAFVYMAWFGTRYVKQEIWRNNAERIYAKVMDIDKPSPYDDDSHTHFLLQYNDNGEIKEQKLVAFAVRKSYNIGGDIHILLGTDGVFRLNESYQFYRPGLPIVLLLFWIGLPALFASYNLKPRKKALHFFQTGLLTTATLQKEETSVLSSAENKKRLFTFAYQTFQDETFTVKITAKPNQWRKDNKNTALLLYTLRQTEEALLVDSIESAPKIAENGLLRLHFSANTLATVLILTLISAFITYIIIYNNL